MEIPKFKNIWLYDNVIIGTNHLSINTGIFDIAQYLCDHDKIDSSCTFYGEESHINAVGLQASDLPKVQKHFVPISVINPSSGKLAKLTSWIQKLKVDRNEIKRILKNAAVAEPDLIIFNTIIPFNLPYFFKQIARYPAQSFMFILHGEIEHLLLNKRTLKSKLFAGIYRKVFQNVPLNLQLITLNEFTKKKLIENKLINETQLTAIRHPLPFPKDKNRERRLDNEALNIVSFGVANIRKNTTAIVSLSELVISEKIKLKILGRTEIPLNEKVIVLAENNKTIPQEKYENAVGDAHYAISFLKEPEYLYRVSGSLLDAVIYTLPIIALPHAAVNELFDIGGNIGYICDSERNMADLLQKIAESPEDYNDVYQIQINNLLKLKRLFSSEAIANELKQYICKY